MLKSIFNTRNYRSAYALFQTYNFKLNTPQKLNHNFGVSFIKNNNANSMQLYCTVSNTAEDTTPLSEEEIQQLTNNDPELAQKLKIILLETEVLRQDGHSVPENNFIKLHHWKELLKLNTRTARKKYLNYLFKIEKKKENQAIKKEQKRIEREEVKKAKENEPDTGEIKYGLGHNCIMLRIQDATMNQLYNNNLIRAMIYGQKLVIDCGYSNNMTTRENINCAKQLTLLFSDNRLDHEAFDIHFCNAKRDTSLMQAFERHIPPMYENWFPINVHEKSYLDLFPKQNLVYLTPHCREELKAYDHDAIYIIGGIVDKINNEPLSMAKAKEEGIKMAKLPLDKYLAWGAGSGKSLTLNQVLLILLDMKRTGDWKYSLRHVPSRKLINSDNIGEAIKSYRSLSYDVEGKERQKKKRLSSVVWTPKHIKEKEKEKKGPKLMNIPEILKDLKN